MVKGKIGVGCLPLFILVIILFIIRVQIASGKSWEKEFTDFTLALYWIGVGYMLLVAVINKSNELSEKGNVNPKKLEKNTSNDNTNKNTNDNTVDNTLLNLKNNWIKSKTDEIFKYVSVIDLLKEISINDVSYSKLLKCFEWQFKRFKILVRDGFGCVDCREISNRLHVHHTYYLKDKLPWEIDDIALVSLCRSCHTKRHEKENIYVYKKVENRLLLVNNHFSICPRCYGTGYLPQFRHVENGICFLCYGDVIPKTIFSTRLTEISTNPHVYNELHGECIDFLDSISLDFYTKHIHEKLYNKEQSEIQDFFSPQNTIIYKRGKDEFLDWIMDNEDKNVRDLKKQSTEEFDDLPF